MLKAKPYDGRCTALDKFPAVNSGQATRGCTHKNTVYTSNLEVL